MASQENTAPDMGETAGGEDTKQGAFLREVVETAKTLGAGLGIALVLRVIVFQPFTIPSSSMEPGLVTGDYIVVSKWAYGWSRASLPFNLPLVPKTVAERLFNRAPARGDVVVFRRPVNPDETWIKRVVGLPGDRIQVIGGQVFVNGKPNARQYDGPGLDHDSPERPVPRVYETASNGARYLTFGGSKDGEGDNTDVYVVPEHMYFMMGDNRDNSADSRWPREVGAGFVPAENLVGRAEAIGWSWKAGASILKPWTWLDLDGERLFKRIR